jgi:hypothetical protein
MTNTETLSKFMSKVRVSAASGCWLWQGRLNACGYGTFGKAWLAHRWAYKFIGGRPLPDELHHKCKVRRCVNPEHTTGVDPLKHPDKPSVLNLLKECCRKGHPYNGDNLYVDRIGHRHCRECRRVSSLRSYFKHWKKNRENQAAYYQKNSEQIAARKRERCAS